MRLLELASLVKGWFVVELSYDVPVLRCSGRELVSVAENMPYARGGQDATDAASRVDGTLPESAASGRVSVLLAAAGLEANGLAHRNLWVLGDNVVRTADEVEAADHRSAASLHGVGVN